MILHQVSAESDFFDSVETTFFRVFWAFGPCIRTLQNNLRPILTVDGTFMKGKYPSTLLVATAADGDNGTIAIAYGVVNSESDSSWSWFLAMLQKHLCNDAFKIKVIILTRVHSRNIDAYLTNTRYKLRT